MRLAAPAGASLSVFDGDRSGGSSLLQRSGKVFQTETVTATSGTATIVWQPPPGPLSDDSVYGDFQVQWVTSPGGGGAPEAPSPSAAASPAASLAPSATSAPPSASAAPALTSSVPPPLPSVPASVPAGLTVARVWLPFRAEFNAERVAQLSPSAARAAQIQLKSLRLLNSGGVGVDIRVVSPQVTQVTPPDVLEVLMRLNPSKPGTAQLGACVEALVHAASAPSAEWAADELLGFLATDATHMAWEYEQVQAMESVPTGSLLHLDRADAESPTGTRQALFVPLFGATGQWELPRAPVVVQSASLLLPEGQWPGVFQVTLLENDQSALSSGGAWLSPVDTGTGVWVKVSAVHLPPSTSGSVQVTLQLWTGTSLSGDLVAAVPLQIEFDGQGGASPSPAAAASASAPPSTPPSGGGSTPSPQPSESAPPTPGGHSYGVTVWLPLTLDSSVLDLISLESEARTNTEKLVAEAAITSSTATPSIFAQVVSLQESAQLPRVVLRVFFSYSDGIGQLEPHVKRLADAVASPPQTWKADPVLKLLSGEVRWQYERKPLVAASSPMVFVSLDRGLLGPGKHFILPASLRLYAPLDSGATVISSAESDLPVEYHSRLDVSIVSCGDFTNGGSVMFVGPGEPSVSIDLVLTVNGLPEDMPDQFTFNVALHTSASRFDPTTDVTVQVVMQLSRTPGGLPSPTPSALPGPNAGAAGTQCSGKNTENTKSFAVGALAGAGAVLLLLACAVLSKRYCSCCSCCCASANNRGGFRPQVDEHDDESGAASSPAVAAGSVALEMTATRGGSNSVSGGGASRLAHQERSASPDESQSLIKRDEDSAAAEGGGSALEPPPTRLTRSSSSGGQGHLTRQDSGRSSVSVTSTQHSLQLSRSASVSPAEFEAKWEELRTLDIVGGTLAKGVKGGESELESHLAPLHIRCIASGVVNGVTKQYFYALDTEGGEEGGLFAAEITVTHSSGHVSALIKGPVGDKGVQFANILTSRLRVLLQ